MVILGIFPWCFTPELYAAKPEYIDSLAEFVRSLPMPDVDAFLRESEAVLGQDAAAQLGRIAAPTQVTFGRHDLLCSTRFADALTGGIADTELEVFEDCAHARIYENVQASTLGGWHSCSGTRNRARTPAGLAGVSQPPSRPCPERAPRSGSQRSPGDTSGQPP